MYIYMYMHMYMYMYMYIIMYYMINSVMYFKLEMMAPGAVEMLFCFSVAFSFLQNESNSIVITNYLRSS